jgi:DNA-directed RNA polymerase subunit M/transcription elongation factor TFIIS
MSIQPRQAFSRLLRERTALPEETCAEIEVETFNWVIRFARRNNVVRNWDDPVFHECYLHRAHCVVENLDPKSYIGNAGLHERVATKEATPAALLQMMPENMHPMLWHDAVERLAQLEEKALKPPPMARTSRFKCRLCTKRDCSFYELQIRCADEPATVFVFCLNCGNRWRI